MPVIHSFAWGRFARGALRDFSGLSRDATSLWPRGIVLRPVNQGSSDAQFPLGLRYFEGRGVTKDEVEALVWFDLAAQAGDQDAIANREWAPRARDAHYNEANI